MKKRIFALLMALITLVGAVPVEAFAADNSGTSDAGMYFIGDTIWVPEGTDPTAEVVETGMWVKTEETAAQTQLICSETEHTHRFNCATDEEGNYTCGGQEDHVHVNDGCAENCAIAEHTHSDTCYQQTTYVKWEVQLAEDSTATYADGRGLPICFFVTTIEEAQSPMGDYENYKQSSWGTENGTAGAYAVEDILELAPNIQSQQGIRAHMTEEDILQYVAQWPNGGTADDFRKFEGNISIGGVNYSGDEYEVQWVTICWRNDTYRWGDWRRCGCGSDYDHIHIDGILTKKIQIEPGTMSLTKEITSAQNEDQTFTFKLYQLELDSNYDPTDVTIGSGTSMTATIPAGSTTATITPDDPDATFGFGYYKLVEDPNNTWRPAGVKIGNSTTNGASALYICINTDGTVQYSTSYNGTYRTATSAAIVNDLIPRIDIDVTKNWNDGNNQDGIRPDEVDIHLLQNGEHYGTPVTLNADNNWAATWNVPAEDFYGNVITWSVIEANVPAGYTAAVTGNKTDGFVVTNTHVLERTGVQVQKVWDDDSNRDGLRPYGVVVQLYRDGAAVDSYTDADGNVVSGIATLTAGTSWEKHWSGLEKYRSGAEGEASVYTVKELYYVDANNNQIALTETNYTEGTAQLDAETGALLITNTHEAQKINITVEKVWNDSEDQDGIRPDSVTVTLTANGVATDKTLTLDESNQWKGTFTDLYVYSNGTNIYYSVVEAVPEGYTVAVTGSAAAGFTVTNTHTPEETVVPVTKVWDDNEDQDGIRPDSVTVTLYADGVSTGKTLTLTANGNWSGSFTGLAKYNSGNAVVYTVAEETVPAGYAAEVTGDAINGYTVINKHTPEVVTQEVTKVWNDANDQDGIRPYAVVITLHINGRPTDQTLTLTEGNLTGKFENLPKYQNGQLISYSVVETGYIETAGGEVQYGVPSGYSANHEYFVAEGKTIVTNTHVPEETFLNVQKVWNDDDNRAGLRPAFITVTLFADGVATEKTAVLNPGNEWDYTFENLPKYADGELIEYTVKETLDASLGYTVEYELDKVDLICTVINTRAGEKVDVAVTKEWDDADNRDGKRPDSVTVTLYANGIDTQVTQTLSEENNWTAVFEDLYKHYKGKEVLYSVVELPVDGYTTGYTTSRDNDGNYTVAVTNTHTPETIAIPVSKTWDDAGDQDGYRPDVITVTLYADGVMVDTYQLDAANNWQLTISDLPKYRTGEVGEEIVYTLVEDAVANYNVDGNGTAQNVTAGVINGAITVTNSHVPETVEIKAVKVWDDANNQDGVRPESVTLHLLANGEHTSETIVLDGTKDENGEAEAWTAVWDDLPKYADGHEINYTVYEEALNNGYSAVITRVDNVVTVTNVRNTDKTTFSVQKVWDDATNQDNLRYAGVAVQLYANGTAYGDVVVLQAGNHWANVWTGLDVNSNGKAIVYTVRELYYLDAENRMVSLSETHYTEGEPQQDAHTGVWTITNTHEVEKTQVTVTKAWDDANDQDGKRPDSVTVELYRNGSATGSTAELSQDNNWTYTFDNLDVHHGVGVDNVYTVVETNVPTGYTAVVTGDAATGYTVTNTHTPETVAVPVSKVWDDAGDQDGKRPDSVTVTLYADNVTTGKTLTLSVSNHWSGIFDDLAKYDDGREIQYTVVETLNEELGYTSTVTGNAADGYTITNAYTPELTNLNVRKVWNDNDNQDGKRTAAVEITLYANGHPATHEVDGQTFTYTLKLSEDNNWTDAWENMPRYHNGQLISYTVVETGYYDSDDNYHAGVPTGYTVGHIYDTADSKNSVATVTNTYTPEVSDLNVQKVWDDANNQDGIRPDSITVELYRNGVATGDIAELNDGNEWETTFTNLDRYEDGIPIQYTVKESATAGYTSTITVTVSETVDYTQDGEEKSMDVARVVMITNIHVPAKTQISVVKAWNDADNQDGIRPEKITVTLYANGVPTNQTLTLTEQDGKWEGTFTDLPKYSNGREVVYTVVETNVPTGYTAVPGNAENNYTVTNTHIPETVAVPVMKIWDDANDQDGMRPDSVTVVLLANGEATGKTLTLGYSNNWQGVFDSLDKYEAGEEIIYTVTENEVASYTAVITGDAVNGYKITNTHTPEVTSVSALKIWDDENNRDGVRPATVTLHLLANGKHTEQTIVLDGAKDDNGEAEAWSAVWSNLPKYADGHEINYTVYEEALSGGYYSRTEYNGNHVNITNTRTPDKTLFTVQKIWSDTNNQDNLRYDGVAVQLYANGEAYGEAIVLNNSNNWRYIWSDLYAKANGANIEYTVKEVYYVKGTDQIDVSEDTAYIEGEAVKDAHTGIWTVTNTHAVEKTQVTVTKAWDDANDQDGKRPDSVTVELYRNGGATGITAELSEDNNWTYTFDNLDVHHGIGVDNVYTVVETNVPTGYTAVVTGDAAAGYTVTNTHVPETVELTLSKVWVDANDQDGKRPDSVQVSLYADGVKKETYELKESENWSLTVSGLPKYDGGKEIVYTLEEENVPDGYTASEIGTVVTNTHEPEVLDLNVRKVWSDSNNQDGKRPTAVEVTLYVNGRPATYEVDGQTFTYTLKLSEENNWSGAWENMPRYNNAQRISYSVVESGYYVGETYYKGVPTGYTVTHSYGTDEQGESLTTITNAYTPETTDLNVQKFWDDDDNRAGLRPESIQVTLYIENADGTKTPYTYEKDGEQVEYTLTLSAENEWDVTFLGMDKYKDGELIKYVVVETALDSALGYDEVKYELDPDTRVVKVTNVRHDDRVSVEVYKVWNDADNQDGKRPESVLVTLYANGIATSAQVELNESNNWSAVFSDLYKHYKGKEVVYTVVETPVDGYTANYALTTDANGNVEVIVTNTHEPERTAVSVSKVWEDNNDQDGIRPGEITVTLYADGVATDYVLKLDITNNWSGTFENLIKYRADKVGEEIVYTVVETETAGYTAEVTETTGGYTITNTHIPEVTALTATKVWNDADDQDGKRPVSITLHLLANGEHTGKTAVLTDGNWQYTWTDLPKYASGSEIHYTVYEEQSEDLQGYTVSYARDSSDPSKIIVTNTYVPEVTALEIRKIWNDGGNRDGIRPDSVTMEIYANGEATGISLVLNEDNNWAATMSGLPKYAGGEEIVYTVKEQDVLGYVAAIVSETENEPKVFVVTNTHEPEVTSVQVKKIWDDTDDNDGMRPDGILVQLYANGSAVEGAVVELNAMNNWSYEWFSHNGQPLYVFDQGQEVRYYVDEIGYVVDGEAFEDVPDGYVKGVTQDSYTVTITNTHALEKTDVSVSKVWEDAENQDGIRPESVSVSLMANGVLVETVVLNDQNGWKYNWTELNKYADGEEVAYTVVEAEVAGYSAEYVSDKDSDGAVCWTITNTHEPETAELTVTKVWNDSNNAEGYRSSQVKVQLYCNGKAYGDIIVLSAENGWKFTVTAPVYENGEAIQWTIAEMDIPKYYSASYNQNTLTVTNTIQSKEIPKTGDTSNLMAWMSLMILPWISVLAVLCFQRKKRGA